MPVSEDGYPYGSIDVNELDSVEPKSEEAKAAIAALKAERDSGVQQVAADEKRLAEGNRDPFAQEEPEDTRDQQGKNQAEQKSDAEKQAAKKSASSDKG